MCKIADELPGGVLTNVILFIDSGEDASFGDYFIVMPRRRRCLRLFAGLFTLSRYVTRGYGFPATHHRHDPSGLRGGSSTVCGLLTNPQERLSPTWCHSDPACWIRSWNPRGDARRERVAVERKERPWFLRDFLCASACRHGHHNTFH